MTDVVLAQIGLGLIGQTVLEQISEQRAGWERDYGMRVVVRALIDSTGGVCCDEAGGYTNDELACLPEAPEIRRPNRKPAGNLWLDEAFRR